MHYNVGQKIQLNHAIKLHQNQLIQFLLIIFGRHNLFYRLFQKCIFQSICAQISEA